MTLWVFYKWFKDSTTFVVVRKMDQNEHSTLELLKSEVKIHLLEAEGGHDWWHIVRVYTNAQIICSELDVDRYVVLLAVLLHDIADPKFHHGDEEIGPKTAAIYLLRHQVPEKTMDHVVKIIKYMSFKNSMDGNKWSSPEMEVVQDADRLDAMGAIGIARAFSYGGFKGRAFFDPNVIPLTSQNKEQYKSSTAPTINHFYEKLLLLKDRMNTESGRNLAQKRHEFMLTYLKQFYSEWYGSHQIPPSFNTSLY